MWCEGVFEVSLGESVGGLVLVFGGAVVRGAGKGRLRDESKMRIRIVGRDSHKEGSWCTPPRKSEIVGLANVADECIGRDALISHLRGIYEGVMWVGGVTMTPEILFNVCVGGKTSTCVLGVYWVCTIDKVLACGEECVGVMNGVLIPRANVSLGQCSQSPRGGVWRRRCQRKVSQGSLNELSHTVRNMG